MSVQEKLERLMKIKGVIAAGHYTSDGKLVDYKGPLSREMAEMVAAIVFFIIAATGLKGS